MPLGYAGGISGEHWFGLEPGLGRDIFIRMVYGMRTSLFIALRAPRCSPPCIGVVLGIVAGYLGGMVDAVIELDHRPGAGVAVPHLRASPFVPTVVAAVLRADATTMPSWFRVDGADRRVRRCSAGPSTARLVRGQVISLREREFVEAARASGAGLGHVLFRAVAAQPLGADPGHRSRWPCPRYITGEAALSFLGIGIARADARTSAG